MELMVFPFTKDAGAGLEIFGVLMAGHELVRLVGLEVYPS